MTDFQGVFSGKDDVLVDVALRIDNRRCSRSFISNEVGSVRQTGQVELFENHRVSPRRRSYLRASVSTLVAARFADMAFALSSLRDTSASLLRLKPTEEAKQKYPAGWKAQKPYLRI